MSLMREVREALELPPTSALPRLRTHPAPESILGALRRLDILYGRDATLDVDASLLDELDAARADPAERSYALEWLMRLVESDMTWMEDVNVRRTAVDHAARILAGSTHALEDGDLVRDFTFPMKEHGELPPAFAADASHSSIHVSIRDASLPPSDAHSAQGAVEAAAAVGVQTYASSIIMCDLLVRCPSAWYKRLNENLPVPFRVMELGAGTGIVGMVAAHVLSCMKAEKAVVHLTDYHEDVMTNLRHNVEHRLCLPNTCVHVECMPLDWRALYDIVCPQHGSGTAVACTPPPPQSYSLLLVADPIYDPKHAAWLVAAIMYLLAQPDTDPDARAHILLPVRTAGRLAGLYATLDVSLQEHGPWQGYRLMSLRQTRLPRRPGLGRQDESEYIWTELAWCAAL